MTCNCGHHWTRHAESPAGNWEECRECDCSEFGNDLNDGPGGEK